MRVVIIGQASIGSNRNGNNGYIPCPPSRYFVAFVDLVPAIVEVSTLFSDTYEGTWRRIYVNGLYSLSPLAILSIP